MDDITSIFPQTWRNWEIIDKIGEGSFGTVYKAMRQDLTGIKYAAIKIIRIPHDDNEIEKLYAEGLNPGQTYAVYQGIIDDYTAEIKLMDAVKGYTNIVAINDYEIRKSKTEAVWYLFIRMELLTPLEQIITHGDMTEDEIIKLGIDLCSALEVCGKHNIVHRDIKPQNIFVNNSGDYKLGDFGEGKHLEKLTIGLSRRGTPNYMAPEVYKSTLKEVDFTAASKVDIYSLGMVLYQLSNNFRLPIFPNRKPTTSKNNEKDTLNRRINGEKLPAPCGVSARLQKIILKACEYEPENRYASAADMKRALVSLANKRRQIAIMAENEKKLDDDAVFSNDTLDLGDDAPINVASTLSNKKSKGIGIKAKDGINGQNLGGTVRIRKKEPVPQPSNSWLKWVSAILIIALLTGGILLGIHVVSGQRADKETNQQNYEIIVEKPFVTAQNETDVVVDPNSTAISELTAASTEEPVMDLIQTSVVTPAPTILVNTSINETNHEHTWNQATCSTPKTCSGCGATEGSALTHDYADATCAAPRTCKRCGATIGTTLTHIWKEATCTAAKTCSRCGKTEGKSLGHDYKNATCTEPMTCKRCGAISGNALGHSWKSATCTEPKKCTRCNKTDGSALGHSWKNATCTEPKTCSRCKKAEGNKLGHNWLAATYEKPETCSRCGRTRGVKLSVKYKVRDIYTFGKYEQDYSNHGKEGIEWIIIDIKSNGNLVLLSRYALDMVLYNNEYNAVSWENCTLRKWLNNDFYNTAFSNEEKKKIVPTKLVNEANTKRPRSGGNDTEDNVWLLSLRELNEYFPDVTDREARMCLPTAYAVSNGVYQSEKYHISGESTCWWWLRSPGDEEKDAAVVSEGGYERSSYVNQVKRGVRPVIVVRP